MLGVEEFMKVLITGIIALVATFTLLSPTLAADPANSQPATAAYINNLPQSIPANVMQWYKFDYVGDKSQITVLMPNGANTLVEFNVFTPEQSQTWWDKDTKPIGRGTAYTIDCETGKETYMGECFSNDLKWVGQFNFPGTFYVQVVNYNTGTANFNLTIDGTGVRILPPAPVIVPPLVAPLQVVSPQAPVTLPVTGGVWLELSHPKPPLKKILPDE